MTFPITTLRPIVFDDRIRGLVKNVFWEDILALTESIAHRVDVFHVEFEVCNRKWVGYILRPSDRENIWWIVYCRGGTGDFWKLNVAQVFSILAPFAAQWYTIFAPQYAWNGGSEGFDEIGWQDIEDVLIAPKIFHAFLGHIPDYIGMFAESRGAIMAYKTLAQADWVKAMVVQGWVTNLERWVSLRADLLDAWKDRFPQTEESYFDRSALCWPEKLAKNVPILLMHGMSDWRVSPLDSIELSMSFLKHKVPHRLICFEWTDHGLSEVANEAFGMTIGWFDRFIKNKELIPNTEPHGR